MLKPVIAATTLLAIAGSGLVYAQQGFGDRGLGDRDGHGLYADGQRTEFRRHLSAADVAAFTDARIAAMKAGLELTPDQAKNWPAFEQAVRDMAQLRIDRIKAREAQDQQQSQQQMSPFDRMSRRADNMAKTSAALKKVAEAGAPLYQSLDDAQKGRFTMLARILRPHHPGFERWRRFGQGYGRGFERQGFDRPGFNGPGYDRGGRIRNLGDDSHEGSRL
ncbi:MAG: Spy/CpxP family protein refolding chaperone [Xanthobacteraceae bacterium]